MIGQDNHEVERKTLAILGVLNASREPLGGRAIADRLGLQGINLCERTVRYHLKLMDERGLTQFEGRRDGRSITPKGIEELESALVGDRMGSIASKMEALSYQSTLDSGNGSGQVPINTSIIDAFDLNATVDAMQVAFDAGFYISDRVTVAYGGESLGAGVIPAGRVGLATVSSIAVIGALLKEGIPLDPRFGGILEIKHGQPVRFVELIEYSGCSLNPMEIFAVSKFTSVRSASSIGNGRILAHFHEIPAVCRDAAELVIENVRNIGINGLITLGQPNEPICEMSVEPNKVGMVLHSGLNPLAAAIEMGINVMPHAMSGVIGTNQLVSYKQLEVDTECIEY
jgi:HTH-type transcriptional regulator, global nitrogen regulator NrpRI